MGIQKNATYKVHNGTDFDEINFKTIAEQVKFSDGTSLSDYFKNGKLSNSDTSFDIQALDDLILMLKTKRASDGRIGDVAIVNNQGELAFRPTGGTGTKAMDLGSDDYRWKDVWVGDFLKADSGYTKLPNGLILQWGKTTTVNTPATPGWTVFPIVFPNNCFTVVCSIIDYNPVNISVRATSKLGFNHVGSVNNAPILWIAIGY